VREIVPLPVEKIRIPFWLTIITQPLLSGPGLCFDGLLQRLPQLPQVPMAKQPPKLALGAQ
jgi:hypothetical protein